MKTQKFTPIPDSDLRLEYCYKHSDFEKFVRMEFKRLLSTNVGQKVAVKQIADDIFFKLMQSQNRVSNKQSPKIEQYFDGEEYLTNIMIHSVNKVGCVSLTIFTDADFKEAPDEIYKVIGDGEDVFKKCRCVSAITQCQIIINNFFVFGGTNLTKNLIGFIRREIRRILKLS